jgi:hypothetical protein
MDASDFPEGIFDVEKTVKDAEAAGMAIDVR